MCLFKLSFFAAISPALMMSVSPLDLAFGQSVRLPELPV
jgi:hypothetical protein